MPVCFKKGKESGLWYEIKCLKDVIAGKTARGVDCSFEKKILNSYQKSTEGVYSNASL